MGRRCGPLELCRPLELSGTGEGLLAIPNSTGSLLRPCFCLVTATYEGTGRFTVRRVEEAGGEGLVLIDREGPYHGVVTNLGEVVDTMQQDKLEVTTEGDWSIRFAPLADTPLVENGATYTGDALVFMDEDAIEELRCVYEGAGEFSVYAAGCDGRLLVGEHTPCVNVLRGVAADERRWEGRRPHGQDGCGLHDPAVPRVRRAGGATGRGSQHGVRRPRTGVLSD